MKRLLSIILLNGNSIQAQEMSRELRDSFVTNSVLYYYDQHYYGKEVKMHLYLSDTSGYKTPDNLNKKICFYKNRQQIQASFNENRLEPFVRCHSLNTSVSNDAMLIFIFYHQLMKNKETGRYKFLRAMCKPLALAGYVVFDRKKNFWIYKSPEQMDYEWDLERAGIQQPIEIF